jgi:hypothetical protein
LSPAYKQRLVTAGTAFYLCTIRHHLNINTLVTSPLRLNRSHIGSKVPWCIFICSLSSSTGPCMAKRRTSSRSRSKTRHEYKPRRHNRRHRGRHRRDSSSTESSSRETSQSRSRQGCTLNARERSGERSGQRCSLRQRSRQASKSLAQEELPGIGSPGTSRRGHMHESRCATDGQGEQTNQLGQPTHVTEERYSTSLQICPEEASLHHQTAGAAERTQCKTARCAEDTCAPPAEKNWGFASDANLWRGQQPQWPHEAGKAGDDIDDEGFVISQHQMRKDSSCMWCTWLSFRPLGLCKPKASRHNLVLAY